MVALDALLIESGELRIEPESRRNEVLGFIKTGLQDFSISRSAEARNYLVAKLGAEPGSARVGQVDELAADLGYLPLALAQAAAFILDRGDTCAGYRARLADRRRTG